MYSIEWLNQLESLLFEIYSKFIIGKSKQLFGLKVGHILVYNSSGSLDAYFRSQTVIGNGVNSRTY